MESTNSLLCNGPTFGLQSPLEINLMEGKLPASVVVEDNSNVEKADSYTKELEDVSNYQLLSCINWLINSFLELFFLLSLLIQPK